MHAVARQQLVLEYYPMVRTIAKRMARRYPDSVDVDDLVHVGVLGLIDSADRFDAERNTSFASYARIRVQGAIVDAMRKGDFVPRSVRNRARRLTETRSRLATELGRAATPEEVARDLRIDSDRLAETERNAQIWGTFSMDETRPDSDDRVGDTIASPDATPADHCDKNALRTRVEAAISTLPERDRSIVRLYYYEELSFKEIGQVLGVTESRVSQLHTRIKQRLQAVLVEV